MNVRNCKGCGKIFNYTTGPILCQVCRDKAEEKFQEVKEYVRENPGVSITDIVRECGVDGAQVKQWLRSERLELTANSAIFLNCEGCGASIRSGRFCQKCKLDMTMGFNNVIKEHKRRQDDARRQELEKDSAKMRFL